MASRTGSFGRLPRAAPDLSGTIVAMLREWQNQEDSNLVNAWQKGGEVDGKKVTDGMLLEHWKQRRNGVSQQDPLWDYYNNLVQTYEFSIAESKQVLAYAQRKVDDASMVAFYTSWARKLPSDSEAYRQLMKSAAQYLDHVRSGASTSRAASKQTAYNNEYQGAYDRYERPYDTLTGWLTQAALTTGILSGQNGDNSLENLRSGDQTDDNRFLALFDEIMTDPRLASIKSGLIADMQKADPRWTPADFTYENWLKSADNKRTGLSTRSKIATKYGDKATAKKDAGAAADFTTWRLKIGDIDEGAAYNTGKADFNAVAGDPGASPYDIVNAADVWGRMLQQLDNSSQDPANKGMYHSEYLATQGSTDTGRTRSEAEGSSGTSVNDTMTTSAGTRVARAQVEALNAGTAVLTNVTDNNGQLKWNVIPSAVADLSKGAIFWQDVGGTPTAVYVPFQTVTLRPGTDPDSITKAPTKDVKVGGDPRMGVVATDPRTGKTVYGMFVEGGGLEFFATPPWKNGSLQRKADGSWEWQAVVPAGTIPKVRDFWDPTAVDPNLMRSDRSDTPFGSLVMTSPEDRRLLLAIDPVHASDVFMAQANGDPNVASVNLGAFTVLRQTAYAVESDANLSKIEAAQRSGTVYWNLEMQGARAERAKNVGLPALVKPGEFTEPVVDIATTMPKDTVAENIARNRAIGMLNAYASPVGGGGYPGAPTGSWASNLIEKTPVLKIPSVVEQLTGRIIDYSGNEIPASQIGPQSRPPVQPLGPPKPVMPPLTYEGFKQQTAESAAIWSGGMVPPPSRPAVGTGPERVANPPPIVAPKLAPAITPAQEQLAKGGRAPGTKL